MLIDVVSSVLECECQGDNFKVEALLKGEGEKVST